MPQTPSTPRNAAHDRFLDVDGVRIRYRDEGAGPTLVLLHGVLAQLETWDGWVAQLSSRFRIVRMDLPGFGQSDEVGKDEYTPERTARFFERVRVKLGLDTFHLAGNSLGGFLSWYYAVHYPEHVLKLVLVDPIAYPQKLPGVMQFASLPLIGEAAHFITPRALVARNIRMVYGDPSKVTSALVDRYCGPLSRFGNRRAMVRTFRALRAFNADPDMGKEVAKIKAPTLLMWGDLDRWVPVALIERWRKDLPSVEVKTYPGLGHIPMEEAPEITAEDAARFLLA